MTIAIAPEKAPSVFTPKFGKLPYKHDYRTLRLEHYINRSALPSPPAHWRIGKTPAAGWPMYDNDSYGDCTIAMAAHMKEATSADVGKEVDISLGDVLNTYWAIGNLEHPTQPHTDQGLVLLDVFKYWANQGIGGTKILAFVKVLPADLQLAAFLFDGLGFGFQCQQNVISDFNNGRPWTPGTLMNEGHAVHLIEYDANYLNMVTWAREQKGTYAWQQECVDEIWAVIPTDFLTRVPSGFDIESLWADLQAIKTPDSPQPAPLPVPTPTPSPTPSPTPAAFAAAVASDDKAGNAIITWGPTDATNYGSYLAQEDNHTPINVGLATKATVGYAKDGAVHQVTVSALAKDGVTRLANASVNVGPAAPAPVPPAPGPKKTHQIDVYGDGSIKIDSAPAAGVAVRLNADLEGTPA